MSDELLKIAGYAISETILGVVDRLVSVRPHKEALEGYIKEIQNSARPPMEKAVLISNAKRDLKYAKNQWAIIGKAQGFLPEGFDCSKSDVNEEFLDRFMEEAKFVSDEEVQFWWASVLAGEFERPGSAPSSLIRILVEMNKASAKAFEILCNMYPTIIVYDGVKILRREKVEVIRDRGSDFLEKLNVNANILSELKTLGLIEMGSFTGYGIEGENVAFNYLAYGQEIYDIKNTNPRTLVVGDVIFTAVGQRLAQYIKDEPIDGYIEYLKENWQGVTFEETATVRVETDENGEIRLVRI